MVPAKTATITEKDKIDLFWSPRHHLPLFTPNNFKSVITINDTLWVRHPETMRRLNHLPEKLKMPYSVREADKIIAISYSTQRDITEIFPIHYV